MSKLVSTLMLVFCFFASSAYAKESRQNCEAEIDSMRDIYIVILKKIPAIPPLAKLSAPIQRALNDAELSRDKGDYDSCVVNMQRQISIVKGSAR